MNDRFIASIYLSLWAPVAIYMALIFALSSLSHPPELPSALPDKGAHALLYFGLGALFVRALYLRACRAEAGITPATEPRRARFTAPSVPVALSPRRVKQRRE